MAAILLRPPASSASTTTSTMHPSLSLTSEAGAAVESFLNSLSTEYTEPPYTDDVDSQSLILADIGEQNVTDLSQEVHRLVNEAASSVEALVHKNWKESETGSSLPGSNPGASISTEERNHQHIKMQNILDRNSSYRKKLTKMLQEQVRRIEEQAPKFDLARAKQELAEAATAFSAMLTAASTEDTRNSLLKSTALTVCRHHKFRDGTKYANLFSPLALFVFSLRFQPPSGE